VPFVYILRCRDGSFYTGATRDLEARLLQHQTGRGARYTRSRLPVVLAWSRRCATWSQALREEYRIKQLPRSEKALLVRAQRARRRAAKARAFAKARRPAAD
jgi:putative endonuclease